MRGGVSILGLDVGDKILSSPRAWGCFFERIRRITGYLVFPTCVGVFLIIAITSPMDASLPHVRGGVSQCKPELISDVVSSPRAWGCFPSPRWRGKCRGVFPTCVGVFLVPYKVCNRTPCLPHVRGGVSRRVYLSRGTGPSSPRAWGCFLLERLLSFPSPVFPTCVGVFRSVEADFLHTKKSSPRAWGCFYLRS